jgi:hypothetical protein
LPYIGAQSVALTAELVFGDGAFTLLLVPPKTTPQVEEWMNSSISGDFNCRGAAAPCQLEIELSERYFLQSVRSTKKINGGGLKGKVSAKIMVGLDQTCLHSVITNHIRTQQL